MNDLRFIGVVRTPFDTTADCPCQSQVSDIVATLEVSPEYEPGLRDVEHCSHLFVLYWLDRANREMLDAKPPFDTETHGVFATRSPSRPNPIGLSVVELLERDGCTLHIKGMDCIDGTPLLDIKPYAPNIDSHPEAKIGWHAKRSE
jgi:formylmethanofuran dehydrogenase subunit E